MKLFLRFAAAGAVGTAVHYLVLIILVQGMGIAPGGAAAMGALAGGICNYAINARLNFRFHANHAQALPKFALMVCIGAALNGAIVKLLSFFGINYLIAQLIATACILIMNFFISKLWIFKKASPAE